MSARMDEPNSIQARWRAIERIGWVQRVGQDVFEIFGDDGAFEDDLFLAGLADHEQGHFSKRRDLREPVRLVRKINGDALERNALFEQCDGGALDEGAKVERDEFEGGEGHGCTPLFIAFAMKWGAACRAFKSARLMGRMTGSNGCPSA